MKKFLAIVITIIIALIVGFAGGVYYSGNYSDDYDSAAIEEKIIEISELTTLKCNYTDEGTFNGDAKKVLGYDIPFTKKAMQIRYSGTVKMGPDLQGNMTVDLDSSAHKATVTIPHSQILSHEIDEDSIQIVYVKNGIFNSVTPENTNKLRQQSKKAKEKSILESNMLDQADENAISQITTLLNSVYPNLEIEVKVK